MPLAPCGSPNPSTELQDHRMWFEKLFGFEEQSPDQVRAQIEVSGSELCSKANGRRFQHGKFETPSLRMLRRSANSTTKLGRTGHIRLSQVVADVQDLHRNPANENALFQVASQFNVLEMASPAASPEWGIDIYDTDFTQGPACAIACGAGTLFRNYFAVHGNQVGQSEDHQIDCLADLGQELGNSKGSLWAMRNGYALATAEGLELIRHRLSDAGESERQMLRDLLRIGCHWNTDVTLVSEPHQVSQAFCSALPVRYGAHRPADWGPFGRLILEAAYEATFYAAILNRATTGSNQVYLTLLGGGAYGNPEEWILSAMERAFKLFRDSAFDVRIVSFGERNPAVDALIERSP